MWTSVGAVFTCFMEQSDENRAITQVADRLHQRFPEVPQNGLAEMIAAAHDQYVGRPIRDYVPVLVEREVVDHLRTQKTPATIS